MKRFLLITGLLISMTGAALADQPFASVMTSKGLVLAGSNGMSLYTFRKDAPSTSNCNDACATAWPPYLAGDKDQPTGKYSIITRKDGSKQWAYAGKPLYFWSKDAKKGDTTGDGFKDLWDIVTQ